MTKRLLAVFVAIGLLVAEALLYILSGNIAAGVRGTLSLTLIVVFSISVLVALMLWARRR